MTLVLDSSATLAWIYEDETTDAILRLLQQVTQNGAWVPGLWKLEIANSLEMSVRRKRNTAAFRDIRLTDLALLPINIDPDTCHHAWGATLKLAERHGLTVYDAAYLELALRRALPLATLDRNLREAALEEKVVVLGR